MCQLQLIVGLHFSNGATAISSHFLHGIHLHGEMAYKTTSMQSNKFTCFIHTISESFCWVKISALVDEWTDTQT